MEESAPASALKDGEPGLLAGVKAILAKDLKHYYYKPPVLSWGLLFPLALATLLGYYGAGMGAWRIVPGLIGVALLFSASSMGQVVVSFDRLSGGFELYMHAPIRPVGVVIGKTIGGFVFGLIGSFVAALALYGVTGSLPLLHPGYLVAGLVMGSLAFSVLAVAIALAWDPLQAITALNAVRFAMIFLGGLIPASVIPKALYPLVWALPMCYATDLIRYGTFNIYEYVDPLTGLIGITVYVVILFAIARRLALRLLYP